MLRLRIGATVAVNRPGLHIFHVGRQYDMGFADSGDSSFIADERYYCTRALNITTSIFGNTGPMQKGISI